MISIHHFYYDLQKPPRSKLSLDFYWAAKKKNVNNSYFPNSVQILDTATGFLTITLLKNIFLVQQTISFQRGIIFMK